MTSLRVPAAPTMPVAATAAPWPALLKATRPRQWLKSVLVLAAATAAGILPRPDVLGVVVAAMAAFTVTAAGCYLINDVIDRDLDRAHPVKRFRPIASGAVSPRRALLLGAFLVGTGSVLAALQSPALLMVIAGYAATTLAYAVRLKAVAWLELGIVASGFLLRALAGVVAASVPASSWFLLVVTAAAVMITVSKRLSEIVEARSDPARIRPVLRRYRLADLRRARGAAAAVLVLAYAGWALTRPTIASVVLAALSLVPLTGVVWLWIRRSDQGRAGAPEDLLLGDRTMAVLVLAWVLAYLAAVTAVVGGH